MARWLIPVVSLAVSVTGCTAPPSSTPAASVATASPTELQCAAVVEVFSDFGPEAAGEADQEDAARAALAPNLHADDVLQPLGVSRLNRWGVTREGELIAKVKVVKAPAGGWIGNYVARCETPE